MNQNCMITREAALEFGLSFQNTYTERPFRDQNWQVVRARENKKIFLWIYERNGYVNLNVKADPEWRDFWRSAYESCLLYTSPSPRDGLLSRMPSSA